MTLRETLAFLVGYGFLFCALGTTAVFITGMGIRRFLGGKPYKPQRKTR